MQDFTQAVADLEAARDKLANQLLVSPGEADLIDAKLKTEAEINAIVTTGLNNAPYVPQTNPFSEVTAEATTFKKTLSRIAYAFHDVATVLSAVTTILGYIK